MIASLIYNTPELVEKLRAQIPDIYLIDVSEEPIEGCDLRYPNNLLWAQNWHRFLMSTDDEWVWMLNSDVEGVSEEMYYQLKLTLLDLEDRVHTPFMITPAFNSPHAIFHPNGTKEVKEVNWIDMCAPLINVKLYKQIGGFDKIFKGYFADVDLCYRARKLGLSMFVDYGVSFTHLGSYTVNKTGKHEQAAAQDSELIRKKYNKEWYQLI